MKIFYKIILLLILVSHVHFGQQLYVCESYTEDGKPVGVTNSLEIRSYGKAVYVLFQNNSKIDFNPLYLFVDKLSDGKFTPFDSKTITVDKSKNWAVTNYEFHNPGIYELSFLNPAQKKLAVGKIEVRLVGEKGEEIVSPTSGAGIGHSKITFCDMIINEKPINTFTQFSIAAKNGVCYAYLNNNVPIGTDTLNVKVWRRQPSLSFDELISQKKYVITPQWTDTFFKLVFDKPGDYKIDVYDRFDRLLGTNIITVNN